MASVGIAIGTLCTGVLGSFALSRVAATVQARRRTAICALLERTGVPIESEPPRYVLRGVHHGVDVCLRGPHNRRWPGNMVDSDGDALSSYLTTLEFDDPGADLFAARPDDARRCLGALPPVARQMSGYSGFDAMYELRSAEPVGAPAWVWEALVSLELAWMHRLDGRMVMAFSAWDVASAARRVDLAPAWQGRLGRLRPLDDDRLDDGTIAAMGITGPLATGWAVGLFGAIPAGLIGLMSSDTLRNWHADVACAEGIPHLVVTEESSCEQSYGMACPDGTPASDWTPVAAGLDFAAVVVTIAVALSAGRAWKAWTASRRG